MKKSILTLMLVSIFAFVVSVGFVACKKADAPADDQKKEEKADDAKDEAKDEAKKDEAAK